MPKLTPSQVAALDRLMKGSCLYEEIAGSNAIEKVSVNGRTLAGLVSRGLATRGKLQPEGQPWQITEAGRKAVKLLTGDKGDNRGPRRGQPLKME